MSPSSTPLVSACVPTYNGSRFLTACLESLLDQDLKDVEILVGDDGSQDDTLEIARRHRDPRLRILPFETRAGMAGNWNRCLSEARGKYVSLVAQDDLVAPCWGERLAELLESHPDADLAFGRREFHIADERTREVVGDFFESKYPAVLEAFYSNIETVIPPDVMIAAAMQHRFTVNLIGEPSFTMVRREHPATRAGYDAEMKQLLDWEFVTRFFVDRPILHCAENVGTFRVHSAGTSLGNVDPSVQYLEYKHVIDSVLNRFKARLSATQTSILIDRLAEVDQAIQLLAHTRELESEQRRLREHAKALEAEREQLLAHVSSLESERGGLVAHAETLESEREHLLGHVSNLERILRKTHGERIYRALSRIKDAFGRPDDR